MDKRAAMSADLNEQVKAERELAEAKLPEGFAMVTSGLVQEGDQTWSFVTREWKAVEPPMPFVKGQKRPGIRQVSAIGSPVKGMVAVARKRGAGERRDGAGSGADGADHAR